MEQTLQPDPPPLQMIRRNAFSLLATGQVDKAIALLEEAALKAPRSPELQTDLGNAQIKAGRHMQAEKHFNQALKLAPQNTFALNCYGVFLMGQDRTREAEGLLLQALKAEPANPEILNNAGLLRHRQGDVAGAEKFFIDAIRRNPQWATPHANIGNLLRDTRRYPLAEKAYQQAVKLNPLHAQAWHDLGNLYAGQRRLDDAIAAHKRALAAQPKAEQGWGELLDLLEKTSKLDDAAAALQTAKGHFPASPALALCEAKLLRRAGKTDEALVLLECAVSNLRADAPQNAPFFYELGQLYDRRDDAAQAFAAFTRANVCKARGTSAKPVHKNIYPQLAARIRRDFKAGMEAGPLPEGDAQAPVFLVGFPRSGTTLLDQIMASHPDIVVAEEIPAVDKMFHHVVRSYGTAGPQDHPLADACYPAALGKLMAQDIAAMREKFWTAHGSRPDKPVFVDKLPLNILHAGMIRRVFPGAKFIFALRHPCDSVLSCYMQEFDLNSAMSRFLDLGETARFYDETMTIWEHYGLAAGGNVHAIRYEDVVADFRPTVAGLLEFLGVPWNDSVLEYDKTAQKKSRINTPSYHQVTQKIYTRASGRWLKYRAQLEPVLKILKPHADRYGYAVDGDAAA